MFSLSSTSVIPQRECFVTLLLIAPLSNITVPALGTQVNLSISPHIFNSLENYATPTVLSMSVVSAIESVLLRDAMGT